MDILMDFLLARIAEDEVVAGTASARQRHWHTDSSGCCVIVDDHGFGDDVEANGNEPVATHIARHDPARVLAEVKAKRRIVKLHGRRRGVGFEEWNHAEQRMDRWRGVACAECGHVDENPMPWPCPTLRALALPYADHEHYRREWRP